MVYYPMDLDTTSTNAMHWAENLVATAKENNFTMEQVLDESWLVGWFANYWAAVYDPLKSEADRLQADRDMWKEKAEGWFSAFYTLHKASMESRFGKQENRP